MAVAERFRLLVEERGFLARTFVAAAGSVRSPSLDTCKSVFLSWYCAAFKRQRSSVFQMAKTFDNFPGTRCKVTI